MPDQYVLANGGTQLDVGSAMAMAGEVDTGAAGLLRAAYSEGPNTDGALVEEFFGVRKWVFPLTIRASYSVPNLDVANVEALLRKLARPGATLDVQPQGASAPAIRFDVLGGRYEPAYHVRHNAEGARLGRLFVETKPLGYWPTWILLGSVASLGQAGAITWAGSIIGDAPAFGRLTWQGTVASSYEGSFLPDFLGWSLHEHASFVGRQRVASMVFTTDTGWVASNHAVAHVKAFDGATAANLKLVNPGDVFYRLAGHQVIPTVLEPAYRGRFRVIAFALTNGWTGNLAVDVADGMYEHMASMAPTPVLTTSFTGGSGAPALDCGEITIPRTGSGLAQAPFIRFWAKPATTNFGGVATPLLHFHGYYLLPVDAPNGIMPRGLSMLTKGPGQYGAFSGATVNGMELDAHAREGRMRAHTAALSTKVPVGPIFDYYRGGYPMLTADTRALDLLNLGNYTLASLVPAADTLNWASASLEYRPRFQFLKGL